MATLPTLPTSCSRPRVRLHQALNESGWTALPKDDSPDANAADPDLAETASPAADCSASDSSEEVEGGESGLSASSSVAEKQWRRLHIAVCDGWVRLETRAMVRVLLGVSVPTTAHCPLAQLEWVWLSGSLASG